jgi:GNAT superfamily N-acetyltransferase
VRLNQPDIVIRPAAPHDATAIAAIHCSNITRWFRWDAAHTPHPARYADLTPYERWQHGGPWLDAGTCQHHIERLINGGGMGLVAESKGRLIAAAELHPSHEPRPYGRNLNLSTLYVHRNHQGHGVGSALLRHAIELAIGYDTFTVAHAEAPEFYKRHGLKLAERWVQYKLPTAKSRAAYETELLPDTSYELVSGWGLPIGRYQNARHEWERTRPNTSPTFDQWRGLRLERHWLNGRNYRVAVILEESPNERSLAEVFVFTQKALTPQLVSAVRGYAHVLGFEYMHCLVRSDVQLIGGIKTGVGQKLFMKQLT